MELRECLLVATRAKIDLDTLRLYFVAILHRNSANFCLCTEVAWNLLSPQPANEPASQTQLLDRSSWNHCFECCKSYSTDDDTTVLGG